MGSKKRQPGASLKDRLFKEYYRFSFFKAVSLLEKLYPEKKPIGKTLTPGEEAVRFSSKPGLAFPPSDISGLRHDDEEGPVEMEVAFMGLVGPSGVLPHWYNEQAIKRMAEKDYALTAFYDMFHHRLISLFYLAWKKHELAANYLPGEKDKISSYLLSLTGLGTPGLLELLELPDKSIMYYFCGLLSRSVPSACAIERVVEYLTGTVARVEQFIERVLPLNPEDQTRLGLANARLGVDTICGGYIRESQTKFRINLGPMGYDEFIRFMPGGKMLRSVFSIVRYMAGIEYEFDIRIFIKREDVPNCILGHEAVTRPVLGWSTWIRSPGMIHTDNPYVTFQM
jgi:type VI secretion system protein ImpH